MLGLYFLISLYSTSILVAAQTNSTQFPGKITCYGFNGTPYTNNTQCQGSNICCQTQDLCDPNRFCRQNNQIIVPACARSPWNNCANICQYENGTGYLPRAVQCSDGSFCCDNDPKCCVENRGIVLNGLGAIVSTNTGIPSATATSSSISSATTTSSARGTPSSTQTSASNSVALSTGAKAGIAVGAVAIIIIVAVLGLLLFRSRRRRQPAASGPTGASSALIDEYKHNRSEMSSEARGAHMNQYYPPGELDATVRSKNACAYEMPAPS